jgi:hypothetical protein
MPARRPTLRTPTPARRRDGRRSSRCRPAVRVSRSVRRQEWGPRSESHHARNPAPVEGLRKRAPRWPLRTAFAVRADSTPSVPRVRADCMAVFAPMPSVSETMTAPVKPGARLRWRSAYFRSCRMRSIGFICRILHESRSGRRVADPNGCMPLYQGSAPLHWPTSARWIRLRVATPPASTDGRRQGHWPPTSRGIVKNRPSLKGLTRYTVCHTLCASYYVSHGNDRWTQRCLTTFVLNCAAAA